MTEEEVIKRCKEMGIGEGYGGNVGFGSGDDMEVWTVFGDRAHLMWPSPRQQRLERPPTQWEVDARDRRGERRETVFDDSPDLPDKLTGAIAWMQKNLEAVPAKHRRTARISFAERREYGESYANIEITYTRPETDEEWAARKAELAERIEYHGNLRRQQYERMRAEFEAAHYAHPDRIESGTSSPVTQDAV